MFNKFETDEIIRGFTEALLFTKGDLDEQGDFITWSEAGYTEHDFSISAARNIEAEVLGYLEADELGEMLADVADEIGLREVGIDIVLTSDKHGAGFWDRGLGKLGQKVTDLMVSPTNEVVLERDLLQYS